MPKTLLIVPTYNEIENIDAVCSDFPAALSDSELLIVDDNSPDGTGKRVDELCSDKVSVIHRTTKDGLGGAYLAGFEWALKRDYDYIIQMDADFSHDPIHLPALARALESHDAAIGSRYVKGGGTENWPLLRRVLSRGGGLYARAVLGVPVNDLTAGFVGWRCDFLRKLPLELIAAKGFGFQIELKYRAHQSGARFYEHPIIFADRELGSSKMTGGIAKEALSLVWKLRLGK